MIALVVITRAVIAALRCAIGETDAMSRLEGAVHDEFIEGAAA